MIPPVGAIALPTLGKYAYGASYTSNVVQVVLGGNWFSTNKLGESGGYLMSDFKSKIFEPLVNRVAQKIFENEQRQSANFWLLTRIVLWNSLITLSLNF